MGITMGMCGSKEDNPKNRTFHLQTCLEHEGGINCMALSEDGSVLATGSEDRTARLWSTKTERCECIGILTGHEDYINCILIEENFVVTGSADKSLRKWDMSSCECVLIFRGHNSLLNRIICNGDFIFSSSYDRTARCWDFESGECIRVFNGHKRGVYPLVFIPGEDDVREDSLELDASRDVLITGSADFTAKSWSFETGKCLVTYRGHTGSVTCMATDPAGKVLFTGSCDGTVRSWDISDGEELKVFEGHQNAVICMQVVNKIMYTGSSDHTGRSWVTEFGDCTRIYRGHKHTVSTIRFHDGFIYTTCGDGIARCHDAKSGALKRKFNGHELSVNCQQIVEERLFTGSHDCSLRVWDMSGIKDDSIGLVEREREKEKDKEKIKEIEMLSGMPQVDGNQNGLQNGVQNGVQNSVQNGVQNGDAKIMIDDPFCSVKSNGDTEHMIAQEPHDQTRIDREFIDMV
ncbi:WD repeat-containing protein 86-like isoform X2 [Lineus longissimus]|uniref:WD repeat-containing protein 86-like isoform X2 n=1 Tax=Lineus longissimus TaxID=88925 RepID=UPI002B4F91FF